MHGGEPPIPAALRGAVDERHWRLVTEMTRTGLNSPITTSMGRLFDAVAALCGIRAEVNYEGQAAIELEAACDPGERGAYEVSVSQVEGSDRDRPARGSARARRRCRAGHERGRHRVALPRRHRGRDGRGMQRSRPRRLGPRRSSSREASSRIAACSRRQRPVCTPPVCGCWCLSCCRRETGASPTGRRRSRQRRLAR